MTSLTWITVLSMQCKSKGTRESLSYLVYMLSIKNCWFHCVITCNIATSFLSWLSCLVGNLILSITLMATSLPLFLCLPETFQMSKCKWRPHLTVYKMQVLMRRETYLHTQCQTGLIPALRHRIFGTPMQYPTQTQDRHSVTVCTNFPCWNWQSLTVTSFMVWINCCSSNIFSDVAKYITFTQCRSGTETKTPWPKLSLQLPHLCRRKASTGHFSRRNSRIQFLISPQQLL